MARRVTDTRRQGKTSNGGNDLTALQPIGGTSFRHPYGLPYIWLTIIGVWMLSLLPWRLWLPAPDLLLMVLVFWCLNEPQRISMPVAFAFGLLMDVHDGALLGGQALIYTLAAYGATVLQRRLQRFNAFVQAVHLLPVFLMAEGLGRFLLAWFAGDWMGWGWLWSALLMGLLWPLLDFLLQLPQRRYDDTDAGSG